MKLIEQATKPSIHHFSAGADLQSMQRASTATREWNPDDALDAHYRGERYRVSPWLRQRYWQEAA